MPGSTSRGFVGTGARAAGGEDRSRVNVAGSGDNNSPARPNVPNARPLTVSRIAAPDRVSRLIRCFIWTPGP
jgi:hypothetical protein